MLFYIYFSFSYSPGTDARPSFFLELFLHSLCSLISRDNFCLPDISYSLPDEHPLSLS